MPAPVALVPGIHLLNVSTPEYEVRGALLEGRAHAVVWDTLTHPRDMAPWAARLEDRPPIVVYSHADWDHVWGTAGLPFDETAIVGHRICRDRFAQDVPATLAGKREAEPGVWEAVRLVPPTRVFDEALDLDLGGLTLQLRALPGHTPDCCVGFVPEHGVLLAGDTVETPFPVVPSDSPLAEWVERLRRWALDARVRVVVPAHGRIGGRELLDANIDYLQAILDGRPVTPPGELTPFYRETHRANLDWTPKT